MLRLRFRYVLLFDLLFCLLVLNTPHAFFYIISMYNMSIFESGHVLMSQRFPTLMSVGFFFLYSY